MDYQSHITVINASNTLVPAEFTAEVKIVRGTDGEIHMQVDEALAPIFATIREAMITAAKSHFAMETFFSEVS